MSVPVYDVVAVEIATGNERLIATGKTARDAEAIITMAVMRRGVDLEFYKAKPANRAALNAEPQS